MKNKKILLIIIVFLIVILAAFAGVYAYIALDIFKSPKQLFAKYANNQYEQVKNVNLGAFGTVRENLKTKLSQTEYEAKVDVDEENTVQVKGTLKLDPTNYIGEGNLKVNQNDTELLNYSLYLDQEKIAVRIPELNDKYFSAEYDTLIEELESRLNFELPKEISELSIDKLKEYKEEFVTLFNKYLDKTKEKLTDDKFSADKNVEVDVNGVKLTANKYTLALSEKDVLSMISEYSSEIAEESIFAEILSEDVLAEFKDSVADMKDSINEAMEEADGTFKVCIYENSGNAVKVEVLVDDEITTELMLVKTSENENTIIVNNVTKKSEEGTVGSNQTMLYTINVENENTTTVTSTTSIAYDKEDISQLKEYYDKQGYYYYTEDDIDEMYKDSKTTQKVTTTLNGDTATSKISLDMPEELGYSISKLQLNYKFGDQVKLDDLSDAIKLENYVDDQDKQKELMMECMQNLQNNPNSLIGMFVNSNSSSSSGFETDTNSPIFSDMENDYKENLEEDITDVLEACLDSYKRDLEEDENTNIGDYLTITKMSEMSLNSSLSNLEFVDSSTIKCSYFDDTYYVNISIDGSTLSVSDVTAYTEDEYEAR